MFSASALHSAVVLASDDSVANDISPAKLLVALAVIVSISLAARYLELGVAGDILVAGIRGAIQLSCLGYILYPIFSSDEPLLIFVYIFGFMVLVSANEACARTKVTYPRMYWGCVLGIGVAVMLMGMLVLVIVTPQPWYNAQYLIPIAGMLINNALNSSAQALDSMLSHLTTQKEQTEILLAYGATKWEAAWPGYVEAYRKALIPMINGLNVIGLVSIPGMMTGQILGGSSPMKAARYQIIITFLIAGGSFICIGIINALTVKAFFDERGRMDDSRVKKQSGMKLDKLLSPSTWRRSPPKDAKDAPLLGVEAQAPLAPLELQNHRQPGGDSQPAVVLDLDVNGLIAHSRKVSVKLQLHRGEIAAIMGPSGIGKSTILKFFCDLARRADPSKMSLHGEDLNTYKHQAWRQRVLYVHQSKAALPGTPAEFMSRVQGLHVNRGRAPLKPEAAMSALGLQSELLTRKWNELSGGEGQRLMVAIALATEPDVLLFDEPTSALDDASKQAFENLVRSTKCTALLVTHDPQQAERFADSVWRLEEKHER